MRIVGVRTVLYEYALQRPIGDVNLPEGVTRGADLAVHIDTDEAGLVGTSIGNATASSAIVELGGELTGEDPRATRALWQRMRSRAFKSGLSGSLRWAISALDCALWDLRAKANGVPLWKELGASSGSNVRAYASGLDSPLSDRQLVDFYRGMAQRGVRHGKLKVGRDSRDDLRRLALMSDALGAGAGDGGLMVDANEFWSPKQAIQRIHQLESDFELTWVEEPVPRSDHVGLRRVSDAVRAPIATGENLASAEEFVPLLVQGAVDVIQIGAGTCGITGALQVAELADAFNRPVAMGNCPGRFMAHLAAALPNHTLMEVTDVGRDAVLVAQPPIVDGWIVLSDQPGAGIEFDSEKLSAHRVSSPSEKTLASAYRRASDAGGVG